MRAPATWPEEINTDKKLEKELERIRIEENRKVFEAAENGNMTFEDDMNFLKTVVDKTNRAFAERYGIDYGFEEKSNQIKGL
jgi:hypothetical protein